MKQKHNTKRNCGESCALISLEKVSKVYGQGTDEAFEALQDISLEISRGEFVSIIGSSGCGKSTLMRIISCQEAPSGGEYKFSGVSLAACSEKELAKLRHGKIALIPQRGHLIPSQSVLDNVAKPLRSNGLSPSQKRHRAERLLRFVGLEEKAHASPAQLSGGQQQRVALARALVTHPEIVLADEPTAALDMETGETIFRLFQKLNEQGVTVILITHDLSLALRTNRVITIRDGTISEDHSLASA